MYPDFRCVYASARVLAPVLGKARIRETCTRNRGGSNGFLRKHNEGRFWPD